MLEIFYDFQSNIPHMAKWSVRFTNMLTKTKPNCVNWTHDDDITFQQLKTALSDSVKRNQHTEK